MISRQLGRVLFYALLASMVVPSAWSQTPEVDPQALVGRWSGSWIGAHQFKHSGKYYLTIERVEGQKVYGRREITIDGDAMRGSGQDYKITLTREK